MRWCEKDLICGNEWVSEWVVWEIVACAEVHPHHRSIHQPFFPINFVFLFLPSSIHLSIHPSTQINHLYQPTHQSLLTHSHDHCKSGAVVLYPPPFQTDQCSIAMSRDSRGFRHQGMYDELLWSLDVGCEEGGGVIVGDGDGGGWRGMGGVWCWAVGWREELEGYGDGDGDRDGDGDGGDVDVCVWGRAGGR